MITFSEWMKKRQLNEGIRDWLSDKLLGYGPESDKKIQQGRRMTYLANYLSAQQNIPVKLPGQGNITPDSAKQYLASKQAFKKQYPDTKTYDEPSERELKWFIHQLKGATFYPGDFPASPFEQTPKGDYM